jgi:hypothetical protein
MFTTTAGFFTTTATFFATAAAFLVVVDFLGAVVAGFFFGKCRFRPLFLYLF